MHKKAASLALGLVFSSWLLTAAAAPGPVLPVGAVQAVSIQGQQLRLRTEHAQVEITPYSPTVLRVRIARQALGPDHSYAVVAKPQAAGASISQDAQEIVIRTSGYTARIARQPFAVAVYSPDGKLINRDEPGLGSSWIGEEVATYKSLQEGERFLGLGEKGGSLDRRGSAYSNWNTDAFRYTNETDPLYATIPFYIGVHHGLAYGLFFDNSYRSDFNFGASNRRFASFSAQGGEMDYYLITDPDVAGILRSYTWLTGRMPLPPLWSLGYQQNRYSYMSETDVMRVAHTLREKRIPADGITLDIHYMDQYKVFTWDRQRFPDPAGMAQRLAALGLKLTVIVDPGVKQESGYASFERGLAKDVYVKYPDGSPYSGEVWPGWCFFPDFTAAKGRAWWANEVGAYARAGVAGLWNDMNEISTWGQAMPNNLLFDFDGQPTTHRQARNVYALNMTRASYEGMKAATGQRPFLLTRSGFAGTQRYSALWTGDNTASDSHMLLGVRLLNSLGLSGLAFTGMDIGGFIGSPSQGLYARWMQLGAFTPYFRNHSGYDTKAAEPWTFGEDVLNNVRSYINLRYRLLPYLYAAFHEASSSGLPVMRSLAIDYTHDAHVYARDFENQYLFGPSLLVAPFESTARFGKLYLPAGAWYDFYTDAAHAGGREQLLELAPTRLPVFVKAGAIIPMQSQIQSTAEQPAPTLVLHLYRGEQASSFRYYEDDGSSFAYEQGGYYARSIGMDPARRQISFGAVEGRYDSRFTRVELVLHGFGAAPRLQRDGQELAVTAGSAAMLGEDQPERAAVARVVIDHPRTAFSITY
ncbi:glycoside hydrolase family 31 protein [Massilia sp. TS11]|uniref:glycoside hydrolase family 31 protein n=1 Tax=Massilia sp. TS11 TaxID=2908003 RepID=UPI001EDA03E0|nr:TIM-barrel domain-containing protein [Massilia sp. TS11]MCG2583737.1 DUF4968 domain-containing protein [Massilia sp. TS11]